MNQQKIFDKVVAHLRQQGKQSIHTLHTVHSDSETECAYRGDDGLKCAIGCLIPDEEYISAMEGKSVYMLGSWFDNHQDQYPVSVQIFSLNMRPLLHRLQTVHDACFVRDWEKMFIQVAAEFHLVYQAP